MASNCSQGSVPLVSVRSTWSTVRPTSSPTTGLPATRWLSISLRVRLFRIRYSPRDWRGPARSRRSAHTAPQAPPPLRGASSALLQRDPVPASRALVVGARADQAVVVVLLDDVRAPAGDATGGDHG